MGYIESAIEDGAKYLVITASNYPALVSSGVLSVAKEKGCVVICHERLIKNSMDVDFYSSCSMEECGDLQGKFIKEQFNASGKNTMTMEILAGPTTDDNAKYFYESAMEIIQPMITSGQFTIASGKTAYNDVNVTAWTENAAYTKMKDVLDTYYPNGSYPEVILSPTDIVARGVVKALDEHNSNITKYPIITAQDNTLEVRALIKQGKVSMTLNKHVDEIASNTISIVKGYINNNVPTTSIYTNNGSKNVPSLFCSPTVVTAADIQ